MSISSRMARAQASVASGPSVAIPANATEMSIPPAAPDRFVVRRRTCASACGFRADRSAWPSVSGGYETVRAIRAGQLVEHEMRDHAEARASFGEAQNRGD